MEQIAQQYRFHISRLKRYEQVESPGGLLVSAIRNNLRPPAGHPEERQFREDHPYKYLGEVRRSFGGTKARGAGGRKARRVANKGEVAAAAIVPGGLSYGHKHGALKKEKRQHRDKIGMKNTENERKN